MDTSNIETGDLLLVSFANIAGYLIRFITLSEFHHTALAIRIDENYLPNIKVVRTGGSLYILDYYYTKTDSKIYYLILKTINYGEGYHHSIYRKLKNIYKTPDFYQNCVDYINSNIF
jgi:hypothetical protein